MDKRSLLFVIAVSAALFLVNMYFEGQRHENLKDWTQQQKAKKEKTLADLHHEVATRTISIGDLPFSDIYLDVEGKSKVADAIGEGNQIVAFRWADKIPSTIFARPRGSKIPAKLYNLKYGSANPSGLVVYEAGIPEPLKIADLPELGHYSLQMVTLRGTPHVYLADSNDGSISIPTQEIYKLNKELHPDQPLPPVDVSNGILMMKIDDIWYPAAVYVPEQGAVHYLEEFPNLSTQFIYSKAQQGLAKTTGTQQYYVIENNYQQLVFSNVGGALAEINFPFQTKSDPKSVVLPIEFDRQMVENNPQNAHFPANPYFSSGDSLTGPYLEHPEGKVGGYYPLIRRDLIEKNAQKTIKINPKFYALNIVSEFPEVAQMIYEVKQFGAHKIVFEANQGFRKITKTYTLDPDGGPYTLNLEIKVEGDARGLWLTSGIPEVEWISNAPAPSLKYRITRQGKPEVNAIDLPTDAITMSSAAPDWASNSNGFLGLIMNPLKDSSTGVRAQFVSGTAAPSRLLEIDQEYHRFTPELLPGYSLMLPLNPAGGTMNFRIYAGPFADEVLKTVDKIYSDPATGYNPDYVATQTFHGWFSFISEPFAKALFLLMNFFHTLTGSWGLSIILLTVALRIMLYPLNQWSIKSTLNMQKIAPEVTAIQERYKKDPKKAQLEIVNLYRERGVNPVSGCLPMIIQIPFLIGMFDLLKSTFELRGAPFIPGWIDDLSAPDVLFSWGYPIPFIGHQFHLLPFLLGGVMFLQQTMMSPLPKDAALMTDQQRQQKAMGNIMAVVFTFMFYHFPSGLNIYWLSSMILGILQQWWTSKFSQTSKVIAKPIENKGKK